MSEFYLATTNSAVAVDVCLETATDEFMLHFLVDVAQNYINIVDCDDATGEVTIKSDITAGVVYRYDACLQTLVINVCDADYYLGTFNSYKTLNASKTTYITGDNAANVSVSQFPTTLVTLS